MKYSQRPRLILYTYFASITAIIVVNFHFYEIKMKLKVKKTKRNQTKVHEPNDFSSGVKITHMALCMFHAR